MSQIKRTYLVSYSHSCGTGRTFHERETDDAPTIKQIESMEAKIAQMSGVCQVAIMNICLIGTPEVLQEQPQ